LKERKKERRKEGEGRKGEEGRMKEGRHGSMVGRMIRRAGG
jgi:hypothetical protein